MGCRLPGGVTNLPSLWSMLAAGRDCISTVPSDRWDGSRFYHPDRTHPGSTVTLSAGLIDNIYEFDADFFGISPKEAESMDPQQRLLLELTWEAMEDAGVLPSSLSGSDTAVFVGAASPDGGTCHADDICATSPYSMTGTNLSIISNRLSYIFNFHGPSFTLDTACSSSLYALHQACQTLAQGGASMAVCAGVNVLLAPYPFVGFSQAYMLSPDGRCKVFDASGNGYVRAEGGGVLLLEPLELAVKNGRDIHAVIRAVACNSDGRTQGIALPSSEAQEELISGLYEKAGCDPDSLSYLEAHGTGTRVGDPLETRAIARALAIKRSRPLTIGSIKSNVGHLETASAMAGILKSIVMLKEHKIPRQLHINTLNPDIDFEGWNLHVPLSMEPLPDGKPARIGVNSFGFGGANGHVLLEEPPRFEETQNSLPSSLPLFLQARSEKSLQSMAKDYANTLENHPESYAALASTLAYHREAMPVRLVADGERELVLGALRHYGETGELGSLSFGQAIENTLEEKKTAFVFAGNGCHWLGMGQDLLSNPVFRAKAEEVGALFLQISSFDVLDLLKNGKAEDLEKTENTQPLIFLIQICLCEVLRSQGIVPDVVYGHSVGEVAAVWAAGILSLRDAVKVVYYRSVFQGKTRGSGKMAAAKLSIDELHELAGRVGFGEVEIAGVNAQGSLTLCGSERGLRAIGEVLSRRHVFFKMLPLDYAFHSSQMESIKEDLLTSLAEIHSTRPRIVFLSTVAEEHSLSPRAIADTPDYFGANYWWQNIRRPVMFHAATCRAIALGVRYFLEISPHAILQQYIRSAMKTEGVQGWVGSTMQRKADNTRLLGNVWKTAWTHGWPFAPSRFFSGRETMPFVGRSLPFYPWNRSHLHTEETPESYGYLRRQAYHSLLGWQIKRETSFENVLDLTKNPWLGDHKVGDAVFFPAAAYLEMSLAAARFALGEDASIELSNTAIIRPIILDPAHSTVLRTSFESADGEIRISGRPYMQDNPWVLYSRGRAYKGNAPQTERSALVKAPEAFGTPVGRTELYRRTAVANMHYGPVFQAVDNVWLRDNEALAKFCEPEYAEGAGPAEEKMLFSPALLDGGLQLIFLLLGDDLFRRPCPRLPFWFDRCIFYAPGRPAFAHIVLRKKSERTIACDIEYLSREGTLLLAILGGKAKLASRLGKPKDAMLYTTVPVQVESLPGPSPLGTVHYEDTPVAENAEHVALRDACCQAIIAEYMTHGEHGDIPAPLARFINSFSSGGDLPSFALLWQTLARDWPGENTENLLLLASHARLLAHEQISVDALLAKRWEERALLLSKPLKDVLSSLLAPDKPGTVVLAGTAKSGLVPLLRNAFSSHSLWLTDSTENALSAVSERILPWKPSDERVHYAVWDPGLSCSPVQKADVLLLPHVLHDADDLLGALANCRSGLADGGRLLLLESEPSLVDNLTCGLEKDWWKVSQSDEAPVSCLLSEADWITALQKGGFRDCRTLSRKNGTFLICAEKGEGENAEGGGDVHEESRLSWIALATSDEAVLPAITYFMGRDDLEFSLAPESEALLSGDGDAWETFFLRKPSHVLLPFFSGPVLDGERAVQASWRLITLAKAWQQNGKPPLTVCLLTFGASSVGADAASAPELASVLGSMRVMQNEMPGLRLLSFDLPREPGEDVLDACARELLAPSGENELCFRSEGRFVLRSHEIFPVPDEDETAGMRTCMRLAIDDPGRLESLTWHALPLSEPGAGEVLVQVMATGLNFRDVMWAMNLLPEEALENGFSGAGLGIECAGVVEKVGEGVSDFRPGDRIVAFGQNCFSSHICTASKACARIPVSWTFSEAASVPVTFFTAYYALVHLASLVKGERLLIHGAAGGVGLAAIQIALSLGLDIYVTAGSPLKRHLLRTLGLTHVYDSRSLAFRDEILRDTEGEGVDCVLNSLAGEAMSAGLQILRPFGRFLELGKSDFFADSALRLRPFRNNISYFGIDVDQLMKERADLGKRLFTEMMERFSGGEWAPLPCTVFAADEVEEAFRFMQKSQHVGKIVVTPPPCRKGKSKEKNKALTVSPEATYLVTGGTSGFGLESARYLAAKGAGALLLVSRSGETDKNRESLRKLAAESPAGRCRVKALALDVTDEDSLSGALDAALADMPPLKGVLHAAALLQDALIEKISYEGLRRVLAPKIFGAFALHRYTKDMNLDFFICYSSITTLMGNPGQVNYVAANAAMESLCAMRRRMGLPGLAVGWGAIANAGMLARDRKTLESLTAMTGIRPLSTETAMEYLASLPCDTPDVTYIFGADWQKLKNLPIAKQKRLAPLLPQGLGNNRSGQSLARRLQGKNEEEAHDLVLAEVVAAVARILRTSPQSVRPTMPLQEMGVDSLMGVELSLALEELMDGQPLSGSINAHVSAEDLTVRVLKAMGSDQDDNALMTDLLSSHGVAQDSKGADFVERVARETIAPRDV
ncbi:MAG: SDR family NAD(P)-dependent oxidoreductase [Desulfovibrio sp.]|nr:SDR family NAD(P)-dependent oxidoreductase [Desulfovibrio sp.]